MSRFFRSSSDSDSSTSSDSEDLDDHNNGLGHGSSSHNDNALTQGDSPDTLGQPSGALTVTQSRNQQNDRKELLLHALLEEKCLNDVRRLMPSASEATIKRKATERYQLLSGSLAQAEVVAPGLDGEAYQAARLQYRQGLDLLADSITSAPADNNLRPKMQRLLAANDMPAVELPHHLRQLQITQDLPAISAAFGPLVPQRLFLAPTRYREEFEEKGVLGRGGYGIVYRCKHKLDGNMYAVKKVPVSASKNQQILARGKPEIDALLAELRVLAQLDHPNIVRYFSGWIDWFHPDGSEQVTQDSDASDAVLGATDDRSGISFGRVLTESDDHVLFENSISHASNKSTASIASDPTSDQGLVRTLSRGTHATVSDEDVESISRNDDLSQSLVTDTDGLPMEQHNGPQLALHMQMSLYPGSLADFLAPEPNPTKSAIPPAKHCFHLQPSIRILLAILDGVAYLHHQQIVHRDLKPGNIFLAPNDNLRHLDGSVDLWLCNACRAEGKANPVSLRVRIGDFGLVTALARDDAEVPGSSPMGTELYRPGTVVGNASPFLDIFALGVIAFELLWPFGTRMERHTVLHALKQGRFPPGFNEKIGDERMRLCIQAMLDPQHESIEEIRRCLNEMLFQ